MVVGLFDSVKKFVAPKPRVKVPRPDNYVFRLHYRVSHKKGPTSL